MIRRAPLAALAVAAALPLAAQSPAPPRFRAERSIEVTAAGPQRLDVDVALLAGGNPFTITTRPDGPLVRSIALGGLADLRLFTAAGVEVPY